MSQPERIEHHVHSSLFEDWVGACEKIQTLETLRLTVHMTTPHMADRQWQQLVDLPQLRDLTLTGRCINDDDVAGVAKLTNLETLQTFCHLRER